MKVKKKKKLFVKNSKKKEKRNKKMFGLSYFMTQNNESYFEGQDLVDEQRTNSRGLTRILPIIYLLFFSFVTYFTHFILFLIDGKLPTTFSFTYLIPSYNYSFISTNRLLYNFYINLVVFIITVFFSVGITLKLRHKYRKVAYGQKGDSKLATLDMIKAQYKEIPDKNDSFEGYGGIPITHYQDKYYIDDTTVNTIGLGTSRSGKGELIVFPMIDNISRGLKKASMVINDPKGELFAGSYEMLKTRGYNIQILNLDDPLRSGISYNPLELVIQAFEVGDYEEATKRSKTFSETLFSKGANGENAIFYTTGATAVSALILALCDYAFSTEWKYSPLPLNDKNDTTIQFKKEIQRDLITMYNVSQLFNQLGGCYYEKDTLTVNALDDFFGSLPQQHIASLQYGATRMASEKSKGNIFLTVMDALSMFQSPINAKMNSTNSLDLRTIGYPQYIDMKLNAEYMGRIITLNFKNKAGDLVNTFYQRVGAKGLISFSYEVDLDSSDFLEINLVSETDFGDISKHEMYQQKAETLAVYNIPKDENNNTKETTREMLFPTIETQEKEVERLIFTHTIKPVALFIVLPDYDTSNHAIGTIFINQLYTLLASMSKYNDISGSCSRRVHFIFDEFGNMPLIADFSNILTVSAGRQLLFTCFLQNYKQLENVYSQEGYAIKDSPQVTIYIKSTDPDTVEEISNRVGHRTVEEESLTNKHADITNTSNRSAEKERLLTPERVGQIAFGETIVLRNIISDNYGRTVRPFPIFNTKTTSLPPRFKLLADQYNPKRNINTIQINSPHLNYELEEHLVPIENFVVDYSQALEMRKKNNVNKKRVNKKEVIVDLIEIHIKEIHSYLDNLSSSDYSTEDLERFKNESKDTISKFRQLIKDDRMGVLTNIDSSISELEHNITYKEAMNLINKDLATMFRKLSSVIYLKIKDKVKVS